MSTNNTIPCHLTIVLDSATASSTVTVVAAVAPRRRRSSVAGHTFYRAD